MGAKQKKQKNVGRKVGRSKAKCDAYRKHRSLPNKIRKITRHLGRVSGGDLAKPTDTVAINALGRIKMLTMPPTTHKAGRGKEKKK